MTRSPWIRWALFPRLSIRTPALHHVSASCRLAYRSPLRSTQDTTSVEPLLSHLHSLSQYSQSHRSVIKLRDQKQLDFEELSAYLSAVVSERDRLAALNTGHSNAPVGLTTYLRDQVDRIRGTDDVHTRRERMRKLDGKIKEVSAARSFRQLGRRR